MRLHLKGIGENLYILRDSGFSRKCTQLRPKLSIFIFDNLKTTPHAAFYFLSNVEIVGNNQKCSTNTSISKEKNVELVGVGNK